MKKLSKSLVLSVAVATVLAGNAVAEESAGFIGVEVGASASKQEAKLTGTFAGNTKHTQKNLNLMALMSVLSADTRRFSLLGLG